MIYRLLCKIGIHLYQYDYSPDWGVHTYYKCECGSHTKTITLFGEDEK